MNSNFVKLEKFDGGNFIRWQKKMKFLFTTLKVVYVLNTTKPMEKEVETLAETRERQKWENDDYICMGHILNGMSDSLFDIYQSSIYAKELWEKLESRYMQEDPTSKKFLVSQFNNYKMVDNKSIMEQMHEIERILNNYKQHQMHMDETIIVSCIIDKLPPPWKDLKKSMKHKKNDISLKQLGNHLHLEEEYRKQEDTKNQFYHEKVHIDSGATRYVCKNKELFKTIDEEDGSILYMGNASTVQVKGKGTVEIEFTSGKILTLKDVFYVPDVRKNLIFVPLLNKFGFKCVFEGVKCILSKGGIFAGKGYLRENISDRGGEFYHLEYFESTGIVYQTTAPYSPQQNGIAERKNRVLKEMVNVMLSYSGLSKGYWNEAMLTGCRAIVKVPEPKRKKLGERGIESVFMAYAENSKAYRFMVVESNDSYRINIVIESREPRRSKRAKKEKDYGLDFFMFLVEGTNDFINSYGPICYNLESDPDTYEEEIKSQDSSFWKEVIQEEMNSIMGNKTWKLVDLPPGSKPIGRLSQYTSNPSKEHWQTINRVLKYLKGTINYSLVYSGYPSVLEGYTDVSWVTYVEDHVFTSGWIFNLGGGAVSWESKKQTCIADSTMAA
ncbi:uncharacterized protein [Cicer arietinum]|uniref:uncharacterized protein n=1 Tax=Cicer arietinum TaxID=3827 RepID=UPI003CC6CA84